MQSWKILILSRLTGMWRYRWWGLAAAWAVCLAGWLVVLALPNKYESDAKVYIDTDTLMRPLMAGMTVNPNVDQEVDVMMRTLVTRPNIEQVAKLSDPDMVHASQTDLNARVDEIQKNISWRQLETKNLFYIGYTNSDPAFAQTVTQSLVSLLMNSNLGTQRRNVDGVETFLQSQIASYETQLQQMEKRRADFQAANIEYLSVASGGDAATIVNKAHDEVIAAQNQLGIEMARRDSLAGQLHSVSATLSVDAPPPVVLNGQSGGGAQDLPQAEANLANLEARFTDSHPDVVAAKKLVERLKTQESGSGGNSSPYRSRQSMPNPVYVNLKDKLADAETSVALQRRRLEEAQANEEKSRSEAGQAVTVAREYANLNRDYEVIHKNYEDLVARREAARLSRAVGDQESDTAFRVIEPPVVPNAPVSPNRLMLNSLILLLGIMAGCGVAFVLHLNEDSFAVSDQLSEAFSLPVLGSVSRVNAVSQQLEMRRSVIMLASGLGVLGVFYLTLLVSQLLF